MLMGCIPAAHAPPFTGPAVRRAFFDAHTCFPLGHQSVGSAVGTGLASPEADQLLQLEINKQKQADSHADQ